MLLAIRHARTEMNEDGQERLRGWLPVPLSAEGHQESQHAARQLHGLHLPIHALHTSPLTRAQQTAHTIGKALKVGVHPTQALSDWNVGHLAGQSVEKTLPIIHRFVDQPELTPPGGEPYGHFLARTEPLLRRLMADPGLHAVVTHNRVLTLLNAIAHKDPGLLKQRGPVEPAGAVLVHPDLRMQVLFGAREAHHAQPSKV